VCCKTGGKYGVLQDRREIRCVARQVVNTVCCKTGGKYVVL